jgi:predicted restriction endonuclease
MRVHVFREYGAECAACGSAIEYKGVLETEVAHVIEVERGGLDDPSNALPLCRTHHWAFDQGAIGIEPRRGVFVVDGPLRNHPRFRSVHGKPLGDRLSRGLAERALRDRWRRFRKQESRP